MVLVYMIMVFYIMVINYDMVLPSLTLIITAAFTANSVLGGSIGSILLIGARRASFSNEAGIGTAPIIHASSKTENPVEEGIVSMIGPFVDTIIVCTLTALCVLVTDSWTNYNYAGIEMVNYAFSSSMPKFGSYIFCLLYTSPSPRD